MEREFVFMRIVKNFLWNAGYQLFILIIPFITIPYVNRVLGPTGVGINSYTNSIVQYFILLGSLGINMYGNREIAYKRDNIVDRSKVFWELAILRFICIFISVTCYLVFLAFMKQYRIFFLIQGIMLIGTAFDISWFFQGMENFKVTVIRSTLVRVISLIAILIFVKSRNDTGTYIFILAVSQALGFLTLWPYLKGHILVSRFKDIHPFRHVKGTVLLLVPQIATQVYLQLNKTMLGAMRGVEAAGFFDNSDKMVKMILAIVTATGTVLLPHVANSFAKGDRKAVQSSLEISMHVILCMAFPMMAGLMAVSKPFTLIFFSSKFASVSSLMFVESTVIVLIGISNAVGTQYLLPTNQLKHYSTSVVLGSIVNILLNLPLILVFGTMGAILATVVSESVVSIYQLVKVRNQLPVRGLFTETWKYGLAACALFGVVKLWTRMLSTSIASLALEVLIGVLTYILVLLILKPRYLIGKLMMLKKH